MSGKVVIVTGASQGLGEGIARGYRERGWRVVGVSRSIAPADEPDWLTVAGDVGDPAAAEAVAARTLDRFGRIDTLVNNAGVFIGEAFTDYSDEQYRQILATNLDGFFHMTRHALPAMVRNGGGHVVQIVTTLAEHANAEFPSVLASLTKGGLAAATRSLAIEYAARGIRANAISPGIMETPMHPAETRAKLGKYHPLGRMGTVADVVQAILYLEDAKFVTGEILHVDGGQVAGH
ncbi:MULTISPECIES: SDR family oxidoreductase [unclassified Sphingomonas]|uniref:SDR family NAD(P)-dependent oxidoreductase n=1 Tax=unclassified Sphingomonas TaxID=196159 RepID=UPI000E73046A|nr:MULTISPECIES: SDR family oxidoreductase [unclassified Sphingomonas]RKE47270.1 NAD(P)-dependent dehydrogenase (short-subunit alcohol dehydrogenase family) [Sphingomonas sp. PP-CC-1A-547]TCM07704.1 NAD(P)-dependent dehydrogenase (short-subunit alcohol dehydrogenase family) [Sphingomonas sp. PP-CC-3G-468]